MIQIRTPEADTPPEEDEEQSRRGWLGYAMLAAAAVILALGAIVLTDDSEESAPVDAVADSDFAPTEADALATVEAYYTAFEAGDAAAIEEAFVEDPGGVPVNLGDHIGNRIWDAAQGTVLLDRTCTAGAGESTNIVVVCEYGLHGSVQQAVDAPATPITERITVTAEGIIQAYQEFQPQIPFLVKLAGNRDREAYQMMVDAGLPHVYPREAHVEDIVEDCKRLIQKGGH